MRTMFQLNPPIPLNTPKGWGYAHIVRDDSHEDDMYWTVIITETGEVWQFANKDVRGCKNITLGRTAPTPFPGPAVAVDVSLQTDVKSLYCMKCGHPLKLDALTGASCGCPEDAYTRVEFPQL